jgi:hypothetical protein
LERNITTKLYPHGRDAIISMFKDPIHGAGPGHQMPTAARPITGSTCIGYAVDSSNKHLKDLKVIDLGEMRCHKRHDGTTMNHVEGFC